jgi:predicted cupin superfamily sugar epimerase
MESSASTSAKNSQFWIDKLALDQHPFMNGYYKEVFRDTFEVTGGCDDLEGARSASRLIYFLHLPQQKLGNIDFFHYKLMASG